jgi:hypothetical protein
MNRTDFFNEILPTSFTLESNAVASGPDSLKVYDKTSNNKLKDVKFIKRIAREKVALNGAPIQYFPIDPESLDSNSRLDFDNSLKDHTDLELGPPIAMIATWTPQEYQMDLSKWGVIMPAGSDQQLFIHVDEIEEKLGRKPLIGDIVETVNDKTRYKVADVFFGHANLWENIFCMITLSKATYDNYTSQLDKYDDDSEESYKETYTKLEKVLNIMDGGKTKKHKTNAEIQTEKKKTNNPTKPRKKSIDTALDILTMKL